MGVSGMNTPNGYGEIIGMFGNPSNHDGSENKTWVNDCIINVRPPNGWKLYYQDASVVASFSIRMHRLVADSFISVLNEVWDYARSQLGDDASDEQIRLWLHERRLDLHGGGYNYRRKRSNSSELSLHSYGIAIDWDPKNNPNQSPLTCTLPDWWFEIWRRHGWRDGRHFSKPDPMHVQFASGA